MKEGRKSEGKKGGESGEKIKERRKRPRREAK